MENEIKPKIAQMMMEDKRPKIRQPKKTIEIANLRILILKNNFKKGKENANERYGRQLIHKRYSNEINITQAITKI
jgi:hypothetical protein